MGKQIKDDCETREMDTHDEGPKKNGSLCIGLYMVAVAFTGCTYWGWANGFRSMLEAGGAYSWQCPKSDEICSDQAASIGALLSYAVASHLFFSSTAGMMLDYAGPRITSLVGCFVKTIGWVLLGTSSQSFNAYIPAFIFIGASTDMTYLPLLDSSTVLFPGFSGTTVALMGSAMSASCAIPVLLNQINKAGVKLLYVCVGYIALCITFAVLVTLFFVSKMRQTTDNKKLDSKVEEASWKARIVEEFHATLPYFLAPSYFLIIPYGCLILLMSQFLSQTSDTILGEDLDNIWGWIRIGSFLACIGFGYLSDLCGVFVSLICHLLSGIACYCFAFGTATGTRIMVILFFFFFSSWCSSGLFTYTNETQPRAHFGKMAGVIFMVAGASQLSAIPLLKWAQTKNSEPLILMIAFGGVCVAIWTVLYLGWRKQKVDTTQLVVP